MAVSNVIPKHWQIKKLGEVCNRITKGGTPTTYGFSFVTKGINFIKVENIENGKVIRSSIRNFITEEAHNYQKKSILEENDLLFSIAGTIGETCLIKCEYLPANTNQALAILRGYNKYIQPQFLTFQLNSSISQYVKSKARGGAMNNISLEDLKEIELVLPPMPEQQIIVSRIEELLSDLENGKQQLLLAQQQLKVYRQSLLKWAFEGKLTNKEVNGELPNGWKWVKINEITSVLGDGLHGTPKYTDSGEYFFINGNNLNEGKIEIKENTKRVSPTEYEKYKKPLNENTILVSINGSIGYTAFYNGEKVILGKSACYLNVLESINKQYVRYCFLSQRFINYANKYATGSTIKNVGLKAMREFEIPLPPSLEEQQIIVNELESKFTVCDKIEESISQSLLQTETLRQSILKKAFEGKLVG